LGRGLNANIPQLPSDPAVSDKHLLWVAEALIGPDLYDTP